MNEMHCIAAEWCFILFEDRRRCGCILWHHTELRFAEIVIKCILILKRERVVYSFVYERKSWWLKLSISIRIEMSIVLIKLHRGKNGATKDIWNFEHFLCVCVHNFWNISFEKYKSIQIDKSTNTIARFFLVNKNREMIARHIAPGYIYIFNCLRKLTWSFFSVKNGIFGSID